ncbi:MAG TPA: hypothetical protein VGB12_07630 [bacterium]|jgi:hypothetical protein
MREPFMPWAMALLVPMISMGCTVTQPQLTSGRVVWQDDHSRIEVAFNDADRRHISDYYSSKKRLPPGLAKKKRLPPGLQKQIVRNGKLPPGLQGSELPGDLERRLSPLPENYMRLKVGTDVVLLDQRTQVVMDVIYAVGAATVSSSD